MAPLRLFNRRWQCGSDDFVFVGFLDLTIRIIWLIAAVVIYWKNDVEFVVHCEEENYIKIYLYGVFAILHLIIFVDIALVHNSKSGSIMETEVRKYVPLCLYTRLLLELCVIAWNVLGSLWIYNGQMSCPSITEETETFILSLVICNWIIMVIVLCCIMLTFDPIGGYTPVIHDDRVADPKMAKVWETRCTVYCCACNEKSDQNIRDAFKEVGLLFAGMFEDTDLVPSDVIAGLIIMFLRNKEMSKNTLTQVAVTTLNNVSDQKTVTTEPQKIIWPVTEEWNSIPMAKHYIKFAVAAYSYPIVMIDRSNSLKKLWKQSFCCGCLPGRRYPLEVEGDNCCFLCSAGTKEIVEVDTEDICHLSYRNKYFYSPFYIVVDHSTRSIVVAIRGTLSFSDMITDMTGCPSQLPNFPESYKAHHGMIMNALDLKEKLENLKILPKLLSTHIEYNVLVTGTSLGAGTASILGMLMIHDYPNLKVYAYAPPGGLLSKDAADFSESFVFSIIYGDDIVPRLGIQGIETWKHQIINALNECRTPKYRLLLGGVYMMIGGTPKIIYDEENRRGSTARLIHSERCRRKVADIATENEINEQAGNGSCDNNNQGSSEPTQRRQKLIPYERLYPPGKLLSIRETDFYRARKYNSDLPECNRWNVEWVERSEYNEIIVSPRMIADHLPFRVVKSLNELSTKYTNSKLKGTSELDADNYTVINLSN